MPIWKNKLPTDGYDSAQIVLIVTKRLVHLLEPQHQLVEQLTQKIFRDRPIHTAPIVADVLTLIVDQVSTPDFSLTAELLHMSRASLRGKPFESVFPTITKGCVAYEGVAYHASYESLFNSAKLNLQPAEHAPFSKLDVSFSSQGSPLLNLSFVDTRNKRTRKAGCHTQLSLPIANTIFETGQRSMASFSRLKLAHGSIEMLENKLLDTATLDVGLIWPELTRIDRMNRQVQRGGQEAAADGTGVTMPLRSLVEPRVIGAGMGNVITKLRTHQSAEDFPASQELEVAVDRYVALNKLDAQNITVWALVIPQKVARRDKSLLTLAKRDFVAKNWSEDRIHRLVQCLWQGAKLRRVLSGGGGWGQKAGLLSLDPEDGYDRKPSSSLQTPSILANLEGESSLDLENIVKRGDYIAFFAFSETGSKGSSTSTVGMVELESPYSYTFGVVPSTIDTPPSHVQKPLPGLASQQQFFPGHFGALSEEGMSLRRPKQRIQTKLDVPNTRFSLSTVPGPPLTSLPTKYGYLRTETETALNGSKVVVRKHVGAEGGVRQVAPVTPIAQPVRSDNANVQKFPKGNILRKLLKYSGQMRPHSTKATGRSST